MKQKRIFTLLLLAAFLLVFGNTVRAASGNLEIYFIDVEGGAATLIVTPQGESLLIDTGFPGERDAGRIAHVALEVAGLKQIDHCVLTHWHRDHFGGVPALAKLIPIRNYYDHGLPQTLAADLQPEFIDAYKQTTAGKSITLKPGDQIGFQSPPKDTPLLRARVITASGVVLGEKPGAPQIRPCGKDFEAKPEDKSDNVNSVGILLEYGRFKFFAGGDLTWNIANRLACPKNVIGAVDLFQVNHHGLDGSANPVLFSALRPRVALINGGPRKGAEAGAYATLKSNPAIEAIYQLHRNVRTTEKDNAPSGYVANDEEACQGNFIKVAVDPGGASYAVTIPAKQISRKYQTR